MEKQTKEKTKKAFILSPSVVVGVIGTMVIILLGVVWCLLACYNYVRELDVKCIQAEDIVLGDVNNVIYYHDDNNAQHTIQVQVKNTEIHTYTSEVEYEDEHGSHTQEIKDDEIYVVYRQDVWHPGDKNKKTDGAKVYVSTGNIFDYSNVKETVENK